MVAWVGRQQVGVARDAAGLEVWDAERCQSHIVQRVDQRAPGRGQGQAERVLPRSCPQLGSCTSAVGVVGGIPVCCAASSRGGAVVELVLGAVVGFAVGAVLGAVFAPPLRSLESLSRRLWRRPALSVHVERDPSVMWAGDPDWVGFARYFPDEAVVPDQVPAQRDDWLKRMRDLGGLDAWTTMLSVTLQADADVAVVVEGLRVQSSQRPVTGGVVVIRGVGGADLVPRHFRIDLDWEPGVITFNSAGENEPEEPPKLKMAPGDVERFHIWADATSGKHDWSVDLILLVDGRREVVPINDDGNPFVTVGAEGLPERMNYAGSTTWSPWPEAPHS